MQSSIPFVCVCLICDMRVRGGVSHIYLQAGKSRILMDVDVDVLMFHSQKLLNS